MQSMRRRGRVSLGGWEAGILALAVAALECSPGASSVDASTDAPPGSASGGEDESGGSSSGASTVDGPSGSSDGIPGNATATCNVRCTAAGFFCCGAQCADSALPCPCFNGHNDPTNCGGCGIVCEAGTYCAPGPPCGPGGCEGGPQCLAGSCTGSCQPLQCSTGTTCEAGTSCCAGDCCSPGQLCCVSGGHAGPPLPGDTLPYCFTPTAAQPTCPPGCPSCL
jgi:hypothetical protein